MKISYNWLNDFVDLNIDPKELAEKIERTAVEVDSVRRLDYKLKKIVVGHTLEVVDHPDSDHLHVCQVDVGEEDPIQIVCGAPNIAANQDVIVALHGSRIKDNVKIKRSKMRGIPSNGMICALQEIGYDDAVVPKDYVDGIYVFPADSGVKPGDSVMEALGMDDDIIETSVTPNRGDMFSMTGNGHEVAAILNEEYQTPSENLTNQTTEQKIDDLIKVQISDSKLAPVYKLKLVQNVKVQPSPFKLQKLLMKVGIRPINNVVDVTNYIMLKYGQPLHAFDYDELAGKDISVTLAGADEKIITLDEKERILRDSDIVIRDSEKAIAIAGVMGGLNTEVTNQTTNVVLEGAIFNPIMVRKTARYHVLHSEAAMRFERGIDVNNVQNALVEAANLLATNSDGSVVEQTLIGSDTNSEDVTINISLKRINFVLGTQLTVVNVKAIFERLGLSASESSDTFEVHVPSRRWDLHIEADLLEEIARIYGYDNIPSTLPTGATTIGKLSEQQLFIRETRQVMEGLGLNQAMSYGLTTIQKAAMFTKHSKDELMAVDWPMTKDHEALRMNLISGLLDDVAFNQARKVNNVRLYEQGRVFESIETNQQPLEVEHLAGAISGSLTEDSWNDKPQMVNFFMIKGIVEKYLANVNLVEKVSFVASNAIDGMHPGRTAVIKVGTDVIGFVGQVHPSTAKQWKIKETYVFDINLDQLLSHERATQHYETISRFPSITRDIAMLVDSDVTNDKVLEVIDSVKQQHLVEVKLFDVYTGEHLPNNKKSLAYTLIYQDTSETLQEDVVNQQFEAVVNELKNQLQAVIR